ncbi:MAG: peptide deformylase [Candidatus Cloacimonas sp.]|jgi:peptide deformylase|nr:peptide deformylase [Candidatus Cloacimonas sp.]
MPKLLPIRLYGDAILREKLTEADVYDPALQALIPDFIYTMYERDGVGLAANQIGSRFRMFVIDPYWSREDSQPDPVVMINPVIETREGEIAHEEGCISVPGIFADVHRAAKITYSYTDTLGVRHSDSAEGFEAIVIQHEYDHLDGILFIDKISTLNKLKAKRKLKDIASTAVNGSNVREGLPE